MLDNSKIIAVNAAIKDDTTTCNVSIFSLITKIKHAFCKMDEMLDDFIMTQKASCIRNSSDIMKPDKPAKQYAPKENKNTFSLFSSTFYYGKTKDFINSFTIYNNHSYEKQANKIKSKLENQVLFSAKKNLDTKNYIKNLCETLDLKTGGKINIGSEIDEYCPKLLDYEGNESNNDKMIINEKFDILFYGVSGDENFDKYNLHQLRCFAKTYECDYFCVIANGGNIKVNGDGVKFNCGSSTLLIEGLTKEHNVTLDLLKNRPSNSLIKFTKWSSKIPSLSDIKTYTYALFSKILRSDAVDYYTDDEASKLFGENLQRYEVACSGGSGMGFSFKNTLVIPYHVCKGEDVDWNGKLLKCLESIEEEDTCIYGNKMTDDFYWIPKDRESVSVTYGDYKLIGQCISACPPQFIFKGLPKQGWSGLPIVIGKKDNKVCGIYTAHLISGSNHISITKSFDWRAKIKDSLENFGKIGIAVPCGMGKSSFLINYLEKYYKRIILIEPRVALVDPIRERLAGEWVSCFGDMDLPRTENKIVITHGKLISTILTDASFLEQFDLVVLDECHDPSFLTQACCKIMHAKTKTKCLKMTASPDNKKFCLASLCVSRHPRTFKLIKEKQISNEDIKNLVSNHSEETIIVQIASRKDIKTFTPQKPTRSYIPFTRKEVDELGAINLIKSIVDKSVILATSVVAYGVTLDATVMLIQNKQLSTKHIWRGATEITNSVLSLPVAVQWAGRVGRTKPGTVYMPSYYEKHALDNEQSWRLEAFNQWLNGKKNIKLCDDMFSVNRVITALKLNMSFNIALSVCDDNGMIILNGFSDESIEKFGSSIASKVDFNAFTMKVGKLDYKVPFYGFDNSLPEEWAKALKVGPIDEESGEVKENQFYENTHMDRFSSACAELFFTSGKTLGLLLLLILTIHYLNSRSMKPRMSKHDIPNLSNHELEINSDFTVENLQPALVIHEFVPSMGFDDEDVIYDSTCLFKKSAGRSIDISVKSLESKIVLTISEDSIIDFIIRLLLVCFSVLLSCQIFTQKRQWFRILNKNEVDITKSFEKSAILIRNLRSSIMFSSFRETLSNHLVVFISELVVFKEYMVEVTLSVKDILRCQFILMKPIVAEKLVSIGNFTYEWFSFMSKKVLSFSTNVKDYLRDCKDSMESKVNTIDATEEIDTSIVEPTIIEAPIIKDDVDYSLNDFSVEIGRSFLYLNFILRITTTLGMQVLYTVIILFSFKFFWEKALSLQQDSNISYDEMSKKYEIRPTGMINETLSRYLLLIFSTLLGFKGNYMIKEVLFIFLKYCSRIEITPNKSIAIYMSEYVEDFSNWIADKFNLNKSNHVEKLVFYRRFTLVLFFSDLVIVTLKRGLEEGIFNVLDNVWYFIFIYDLTRFDKLRICKESFKDAAKITSFPVMLGSSIFAGLLPTLGIKSCLLYFNNKSSKSFDQLKWFIKPIALQFSFIDSALDTNFLSYVDKEFCFKTSFSVNILVIFIAIMVVLTFNYFQSLIDNVTFTITKFIIDVTGQIDSFTDNSNKAVNDVTVHLNSVFHSVNRLVDNEVKVLVSDLNDVIRKVDENFNTIKIYLYSHFAFIVLNLVLVLKLSLIGIAFDSGHIVLSNSLNLYKVILQLSWFLLTCFTAVCVSAIDYNVDNLKGNIEEFLIAKIIVFLESIFMFMVVPVIWMLYLFVFLFSFYSTTLTCTKFFILWFIYLLIRVYFIFDKPIKLIIEKYNPTDEIFDAMDRFGLSEDGKKNLLIEYLGYFGFYSDTAHLIAEGVVQRKDLQECLPTTKVIKDIRRIKDSVISEAGMIKDLAHVYESSHKKRDDSTSTKTCSSNAKGSTVQDSHMKQSSDEDLIAKPSDKAVILGSQNVSTKEETPLTSIYKEVIEVEEVNSDSSGHEAEPKVTFSSNIGIVSNVIDMFYLRIPIHLEILFRSLKMVSSYGYEILYWNRLFIGITNHICSEAFDAGTKESISNGPLAICFWFLMTDTMKTVIKAFKKGIDLKKFDEQGMGRATDWLNARIFNDYDQFLKIPRQYCIVTTVNVLIIVLFNFKAVVMFFLLSLVFKVSLNINLLILCDGALSSYFYGVPLWSFLIFLTLTCTGSDSQITLLKSVFVATVITTSSVKIFDVNLASSVLCSFETHDFGVNRNLIKSVSSLEMINYLELDSTNKDSFVPLFQGTLNTRASLFAAMNYLDLLPLSNKVDVLVIGSGKGGLLQGFCKRIDRKSSITCVTLPETAYCLDVKLKNTLDNNGINLKELLIPESEFEGRNFDLVICDVIQNPRTKSSYLGSRFSQQVKMETIKTLENSIIRTKTGGDTSIVIRCDQIDLMFKIVDVMSLFYYDVSVIIDPVMRGTANMCIHGKNKRNTNDINISNTFTSIPMFDRSEEEIIQLMSIITNHVSSFMSGDKIRQVNSEIFLKKLILNVDVIIPVSELSYRESPIINRGFDELVDKDSLHKSSFENILKTFDKGLLDNRFDSLNNAFFVHGRTFDLPVQDREFVSGISVPIHSILSEARVLPLKIDFDVPSQSNEAVAIGLKRRYDFKRTSIDLSSFIPAIDLIRKLSLANCHEYDFSILDWDQVHEAANLASTKGFMSKAVGKNSGAIIKEERGLLNKTLNDMIINPKVVNNIFHASPKVEKKGADDNKTLIPRLFTYKCAEVRLCELALFNKLNNYFGKSGNFLFSSTGDIFDKSLKMYQQSRRFKKPAYIEIESSKWDGHKEFAWFKIARDIFIEVLEKGQNGECAAKVCRDTLVTDGLGFVYSCSGHFIQFLRGSQKSGSWDTSINNKVVNSIIALALCMEALGIYDESVLMYVSIKIEGDDGWICAEEGNAEMILKMRNEVYARAGFPQTGDPILRTDIRESKFCSHGIGFTTIYNIPVPIRDGHEMFGRLLVSLANGSLNLTYENASRTLSSMISYSAMFWFIPEIRYLLELVKKITPKDVHIRGVHPSEKWKMVNFLGDLDIKTFDLNNWVRERFPVVKDVNKVNLDSESRKIMRINDFMSILDVKIENISMIKMSWIKSSNSFDETEIYYGSLLEREEILKDIDYLMIRSFNPSMTFNSKLQLMKLLRDGIRLDHISVSVKSLLNALKKSQARTLIIKVNTLSNIELSFIDRVFNAKSLRRLGCSCERVLLVNYDETMKFLNLRQGRNIVHFTSELSYWKILLLVFVGIVLVFYESYMAFLLFLTALLILYIGFSEEVVKKTSVSHDNKGRNVDKYQKIYNKYGKVLITFNEVVDNVDFTMADSELTRDETFDLAVKNVFLRANSFSDARPHLHVDLMSLVEKERRFCIFTVNNGNVEVIVFYKSNYKNDLSKYKILDKLVESVAQLKNPISKKKFKSLSPVNWTLNGSMLTTHVWVATTEYGQLTRLEDWFQKLTIKEGTFLMRISDVPILTLDGSPANKYVYPSDNKDRPTKGFLVFGESSDNQFRDIPRPFGADLLSFNYQPNSFKDRKEKLFFRGGVTGRGFTRDQNTRMEVICGLIDTADPKHLDVGFNRQNKRLRVHPDLSVGITLLEEKYMADRVDMEKWSLYKFVLIIEGNEAPDRIGQVMRMYCIPLIVTTQKVLSSRAWYQSLLVDHKNCIFVSSNIDDIMSKYYDLRNNPNKCDYISSNAGKLGKFICDRTNQINYSQNVIWLSKTYGMMNSKKDEWVSTGKSATVSTWSLVNFTMVSQFRITQMKRRRQQVGTKIAILWRTENNIKFSRERLVNYFKKHADVNNLRKIYQQDGKELFETNEDYFRYVEELVNDFEKCKVDVYNYSLNGEKCMYIEINIGVIIQKMSRSIRNRKFLNVQQHSVKTLEGVFKECLDITECQFILVNGLLTLSDIERLGLENGNYQSSNGLGISSSGRGCVIIRGRDFISYIDYPQVCLITDLNITLEEFRKLCPRCNLFF